MTFSSGGPPFVALVSLSNKGEIQYTGVDARWAGLRRTVHLSSVRFPRARARGEEERDPRRHELGTNKEQWSHAAAAGPGSRQDRNRG